VIVPVVCVAVGCLCALTWASAQAAVPQRPALERLALEPPREPAAPVAIVLVAADVSPVSQAIDRISGGGGFSHCYLDVSHRLPDGTSLVVDYQPGAGVHYARDDAYAHRARARIQLGRSLGDQIWGCVRARLGDPFDAAGALVGRATLGTCSGLLYGCLPPALQRSLGSSGRQVAPNDLARLFGARMGETVRYLGG
jgi:hypothetical protein